MTIRCDLIGRTVLAGAAALLLAAGAASAQNPPVVYGQPAPDRSATCIRLEGQLAQLDRGGGQRNSEQAVGQLRANVDNLSAQVRQMGCDKRGFLIFQPQLPPQCDALNRQLTQARSALDRATMQSGDSGINEQRRQLVYQLAQNDCGPQYRAALGGGQPGGGGGGGEARRPRNFFEQLFGVPRDMTESDETGPLDIQPMEMPKVSTYRTVCVRTCDGFFFPISFAATPARFPTDEQLCQRQCPGTEARLFAYRNPGGDIENATAVNGQPYMSLPNAMLFKKQYVSACSCRPAGMGWAQALQGADGDVTLRKGDIVVTEDKAREMSQPLPATPAAATKPKPQPQTQAQPPQQQFQPNPQPYPPTQQFSPAQ